MHAHTHTHRQCVTLGVWRLSRSPQMMQKYVCVCVCLCCTVTVTPALTATWIQNHRKLQQRWNSSISGVPRRYVGHVWVVFSGLQICPIKTHSERRVHTTERPERLFSVVWIESGDAVILLTDLRHLYLEADKAHFIHNDNEKCFTYCIKYIQLRPTAEKQQKLGVGDMDKTIILISISEYITISWKISFLMDKISGHASGSVRLYLSTAVLFS